MADSIASGATDSGNPSRNHKQLAAAAAATSNASAPATESQRSFAASTLDQVAANSARPEASEPIKSLAELEANNNQLSRADENSNATRCRPMESADALQTPDKQTQAADASVNSSPATSTSKLSAKHNQNQNQNQNQNNNNNNNNNNQNINNTDNETRHMVINVLAGDDSAAAPDDAPKPLATPAIKPNGFTVGHEARQKPATPQQPTVASAKVDAESRAKAQHLPEFRTHLDLEAEVASYSEHKHKHKPQTTSLKQANNSDHPSQRNGPLTASGLFQQHSTHSAQPIYCRRRKLTFIQGLLLRKWPCFALSVCIMSSLAFGLLLSVLTVYLMQNLACDCSAIKLLEAAATLDSNPLNTRQVEGLDSLFQAQLNANPNTNGFEPTRLYLAAGEQANLSAPTSGGRPSRFQRLSGALWPIHYDLFIEPQLAPPFDFSGKVSIRIKCKQATDNITLHSKQLKIAAPKLELCKLSSDSTGEPPNCRSAQPEAAVQIKGLQYDKELEHSIILLGSQLERGSEYLLNIEFSGLLAEDLAGFYRSKYEQPGSKEPIWLAATQFEPTDARKAFPCFDEPLYKATFSIQIKHWRNYTSISNMPLIGRQESPDKLWVTDTFEKTHLMSTYLVAFAVTNFASRSDGNITIWTRPNLIHAADYALNITGKILRYYEQFFGVEYPLPKMDMIALPDFNAGAMENWGLVTYRETALLHDPSKTSVLNKRRIATVVAHELAHQWFGNLVTPKWWDDLWLNEGFATFVEYLGVDYIEPRWRMQDYFTVDELQSCLKLDAVPSSHPISVPVNSPEEINEIFDYVSYTKGASVIRMMNHFLTEPVLTAGLTTYLQGLKYGNAQQSDLWAHLTAAQPNGSSRVNISSVMNSWTLQVGYPLVTLRREYEQTQRAHLEQVKYDPIGAFKSGSNGSSHLVHASGTKWEVPITMTHKSDATRSTLAKMWLHQNDSGPIAVPARLLPESSADWVLVNVDQAGFYRVNYDERNWKLIIEQLKTEHTKFSAMNRAQIIDDLFDLARHGIVGYSLAMEATKYLPKEKDFSPWDSVQTSLSFIDTMLQRSSIYGSWKAYLGRLMEPQIERYRDAHWTVDGSRDRAEERDDVIRAIDLTNAVHIACHVENGQCISKAKLLFEQWRRTGHNNIDPTLRAYVYIYAISHGSSADWDFLWQAYLKEEFASERDRLLKALCRSREPWILNRLLEWSFLSTDSGIRRQDANTVFNSISAANPYGRDVAFNFLSDNWATLKENFGKSSFGFGNMIKSLASSRNTQSDLNQVLNFYESVKGDLGTSKRAFQMTIEEIEGQVAWRKRNYKFFEDWLKDVITTQM